MTFNHRLLSIQSSGCEMIALAWRNNRKDPWGSCHSSRLTMLPPPGPVIPRPHLLGGHHRISSIRADEGTRCKSSTGCIGDDSLIHYGNALLMGMLFHAICWNNNKLNEQNSSSWRVWQPATTHPVLVRAKRERRRLFSSSRTRNISFFLLLINSKKEGRPYGSWLSVSFSASQFTTHFEQRKSNGQTRGAKGGQSEKQSSSRMSRELEYTLYKHLLRNGRKKNSHRIRSRPSYPAVGMTYCLVNAIIRSSWCWLLFFFSESRRYVVVG